MALSLPRPGSIRCDKVSGALIIPEWSVTPCSRCLIPDLGVVVAIPTGTLSAGRRCNGCLQGGADEKPEKCRSELIWFGLFLRRRSPDAWHGPSE